MKHHYFGEDNLQECISRLENRIVILEGKVNKPKIKQLEWEGFYYADVIEDLIAYKIEEYDNEQCYVYFNGILMNEELPLKSLDQAKAYAQTHFENLIRGCLENN